MKVKITGFQAEYQTKDGKAIASALLKTPESFARFFQNRYDLTLPQYHALKTAAEVLIGWYIAPREVEIEVGDASKN